MAIPVTRTWVAGEVVIDDHFNTYIRDPLNFLLNERFLWVIKSETESVTSSITVQDDAELRLTLAAGGTYRVDLDLGVTGPTAGDIRAAWNDPPGMTCHRRIMQGMGSGLTTADDQLVRFNSNMTLTSELGTGLIAGHTPYREVLFVTVGVTDADLRFRWAQVTSNAAASNVLVGSAMMATRLG